MRHVTFLVALNLLGACVAAPVPQAHPPSPKTATSSNTTEHAATANRDTPDEREVAATPKDDAVTATDSATSSTTGATSGSFKQASDQHVTQLASSQNEVGFALYQSAVSNDDNFAMSPASISMAFAMVYAGAEGDTAKEMRNTFRYPLPSDDVHNAFGTQLRRWTGTDKKKRPYQLAIANGLFGETTLGFRTPFVNATASHYQAKMQRLDFRNNFEPARKHINTWIAKRTNQRIRDLLPKTSVHKRTSLVLANAIFFKGKWEHSFDDKRTLDAPFSTLSRKTKAKMMHLRKDLRFAEHDGMKMLELPYQGDDLVMRLVLPDATDGLPKLEKKLATTFAALGDRLVEHEVVVSIPRFTAAPQKALQLSTALKAMGLTDIFDAKKANLGGMVDLSKTENLYVEEAFHKAFVQVNEEGTEAAAATAITVARPPSVPPPPKVFNADHPFFFAIQDRRSGAILFMGRVTDPTK